jgi:hypothetical protein
MHSGDIRVHAELRASDEKGEQKGYMFVLCSKNLNVLINSSRQQGDVVDTAQSYNQGSR